MDSWDFCGNFMEDWRSRREMDTEMCWHHTNPHAGTISPEEETGRVKRGRVGYII